MNRNVIVWIVLLLLTSASILFVNSTYSVLIILAFSFTKMALVSFQFMEMRHAHGFWKVLLIGLFLGIFVGFKILLS